MNIADKEAKRQTKKRESKQRGNDQGKVRDERFPAHRLVLGALLVVGALPLLAAAPGIMQAFSAFQKLDRLHRRYQSPVYLNGLIRRLHQKGYIAINRSKRGATLSLTTKGRIHYLTLLARERKGKQKWDGQWRVVVFDVAERYRAKRRLLRGALQEIGFAKLQNSVWAYPYACEELVELIRTDIQLGRQVVFMTAAKIEEDAWLRRRFRLPGT